MEYKNAQLCQELPSDVAFVIIRKGCIVGLESYGVQIKINDFYLETSSLTCGNIAILQTISMMKYKCNIVLIE